MIKLDRVLFVKLMKVNFFFKLIIVKNEFKIILFKFGYVYMKMR